MNRVVVRNCDILFVFGHKTLYLIFAVAVVLIWQIRKGIQDEMTKLAEILQLKEELTMEE
ncbi:MAG: hypothetical protein WD824_14090 [Cyclobacteriaceae bacterium]